MLSEAKARDAEEGRLFGGACTRDELPEQPYDPRSRLARLVAAKARWDKEAAEVAVGQGANIYVHKRKRKGLACVKQPKTQCVFRRFMAADGRTLRGLGIGVPTSTSSRHH